MDPQIAKLVRIGVVTADPLRTVGMAEILGHSVEVVECSASATLRDYDLDLILLDEPSEEHLFSLMAAYRRARPSLRLIVLGSQNDPEFIQRIIAAGAKGYLAHTASGKEIEMCVSVVREGSVWAPRKVLSRLLDLSPQDARQHMEPSFTPREKEVLELLAGGHSNREIAKALLIDEATVKAHVSRLLRKVGVDNRVALTIRTLEKHIIVPKRR